MFLWILSACFGPRAFHNYSLSMGIVAVAFGLAALLLLSFKWLNKQDLFAPWVAFPIAYIIWFSVGSFNLLGDPYPPPYGLMTLGLACYTAGVWTVKVSRRGLTAKQVSAAFGAWSDEKLLFWLFMIGVITFAAYLWIAALMGIPGFGSGAAEGRLKLINYGKSQFLFLCGAWTLLILIPTRLWTGKLTRFGKFYTYTVLVVASLIVLSLGSRGNLLIPLMVALISRHYILRSTRLRWAVPLAIVLFITASLFGWVRDEMIKLDGIGNLNITDTSLFSLYFYVRNTVTTLRDVVATIPSAVPYQHGYLSFGALLSVLPGHHISSDMFFRQILGLEFVGFGQPATLLGPMYGDFGVWGVVCQMFLVGVFYTRLYYWMLSRKTVFRVIIYAWISQLVLFSLFGSLLTYFIDLAVPLGLIILNSLFLSGREYRITNIPRPVALRG